MTSMTNGPAVDPRFPTEVVVEVAYNPHGDHGGPDPEIAADLDALDQRLRAVIGDRGQDVGRAAEDGLAQLIFYTEEDVDLVAAIKDVAETWAHGGVDVRPM